MTKEDKELLLKDLSGRLPYGVICKISFYEDDVFIENLEGINVKYNNQITTSDSLCNIECVKPYLRPMSSMTRQECTQLNVLLPRYFIVTPERLTCLEHINGGIINFEVLDTIIDFYNSHHLDWRGLIPKGLALEASKDMYKF